MPGLLGFADRVGRSEPGVGLGGFGRNAAGGLKAGDPLLKAPDAGVGGDHVAPRIEECGVHGSSSVLAMSVTRE